MLDTARLALAGTVDWTADRTPVMEELRLIKRRLLRRAFNEANGPDSISHLVMITSAKPREGKTFTSTNIAISISLEEDYNVLLVDADVRRQALRQNLGLVVGLQGRFAEAESIVKADLPPEQAEANVAYLKQMLSRKDNPRSASGKVPMASLNAPD